MPLTRLEGGWSEIEVDVVEHVLSLGRASFLFRRLARCHLCALVSHHTFYDFLSSREATSIEGELYTAVDLMCSKQREWTKQIVSTTKKKGQIEESNKPKEARIAFVKRIC